MVAGNGEHWPEMQCQLSCGWTSEPGQTKRNNGKQESETRKSIDSGNRNNIHFDTC